MRRRAARLALATAALGSVLLPALAPTSYAGPPAPAQSGATAPRATVADGFAVSVRSVTPAVALNHGSVVVVASVRNTGTTAASGITVTLSEGGESVATRAEVADWATDHDAPTGAVLAKVALPGTLAPGAGGSVTLTVPDPAAGRKDRWGAIPVSVDATAGAVSGRVHTFLGYQVEKQYVPLTTAVALPLVLDTDPQLSGTAATRATAWTAATAPTSRLGRILAGSAQTSTSYVLDPALTATPYVESTAGTSTGATTTTTAPSTTDPALLSRYAASTTELQARTDLASRISTDQGFTGPGAATSKDRLLLPMGDPDIAAPTVRTAVNAAVRATAESDGSSVGPTLAWPADGAWSDTIETTVRAAYGPDLRVAVISSDWLLGGDRTAEANERSATGLPLAVYDAPLSRLLGRTTAGASTLALQQFVADSAALVGERSGTARSLLLLGPRGLNPAPGELSRLLTGIGSGIPWITTVGARTVIVDGSATPAELPLAQLAPKPPSTPGSLLTPDTTAQLHKATDIIGALSSVRGDGTTFATPWLQAGQALLATGWRSASTRWRTLDTALSTAATAGAAGVFVSPRQINFLADSGRIQITVVNDLSVPVHDLTLTLRPDNPRLRIESPTTTVTIGAKSRTTRMFRATALAAGPVPITATLTAPDGTILRQDAPVRISVTPTGNWMYWALGAIAGTILIVGIWRGVRRGRPVAAAAEVTAQ